MRVTLSRYAVADWHLRFRSRLGPKQYSISLRYCTIFSMASEAPAACERASFIGYGGGSSQSPLPAPPNAAMLEVFASPARFAALVGDHPQPVIGLVADLLAEGQRRGQVRTDIDAGAAAVALSAGCMFVAVQAAAAGADAVQGANA